MDMEHKNKNSQTRNPVEKHKTITYYIYKTRYVYQGVLGTALERSVKCKFTGGLNRFKCTNLTLIPTILNKDKTQKVNLIKVCINLRKLNNKTNNNKLIGKPQVLQ